MAERLKAFHLNVTNFSDESKNLPAVRQMREIFGKNVLSFWDAMKEDVPLICSEAWLCPIARDAINYIDRLEAIANYPHPIATFFRHEGRWQLNALPIELVRCFDLVFTFNPIRVPFPAVRWFRSWPDVRSWRVPFEKKEYDLCYVGRPDSRKKPSWVAAMLEACGGKTIVAMILTGVSGIAIYNVCDLFNIPRRQNPSRSEIEEIFNLSRFLAYPTDFGPDEYDTLENSMSEAIVGGCVPILNSAYCRGRFKGYPAQVSSLDDAYRMASARLTKKLWEDSLAFMESVDAVKHSCRTNDELREILFAQEYRVDPNRKQRCERVIDLIKANRHPVRFNSHGPFYRVTENKTFDFEEIEYL